MSPWPVGIAPPARLERVGAAAALVLTASACAVSGSSHSPDSSATPSVSPSRAATVVGRVLAGPTCPVERAGSPCPPRPVPHAVVRAQGNGSAATDTTDAQGHYEISLPAGTYTLTVTPADPRCPPTTVTLAAGATALYDILCDTGIR